MDTENRLMVPRAGGRGWGKWVKLVKRYKLPMVRLICLGDVIFSKLTIVNSTVFCI